ncbi:YheC/YheD family protein [Bacillus aerolatus]|uniref:YheC/YheD family protein n=1 Tax=Bacillus aerolatus TaxID=2653354 RepID=A0A6I1FIR0_9BACI|nr:YheC/YheD family protein [Bacillus aerolatus]KAB7705989.1 YheC/YheD family protein [Bacillus aerolatus]
MVLIGMLHHRADPRNVKKAYAYAAVAKAEGVHFFYFTPGKVNVKKQRILGKVYENGNWHDKEFPYPDVIFNASPPMSDKAERIVDELSSKIPFTSHSIGNKLSVHNRIVSGKEFEPYVIPTYNLTSDHDCLAMIQKHSKIIIKPVSGHQGDGIAFIEENGKNQYKINDQGKESIVNKQGLLDFLSSKMQEHSYLVQPFISCKIKSGHVYDFRLHVQKNGEGKWVITSIYPRIGPLGTITSNMGSGGYSAFTDKFLQAEFDDSWYDIQRQLEWFALNFPSHFESLYKNDSFDELGIDVGIDQKRKLWIFEVNWRPGPPNIFNLELDVARNTIHYAAYLAKNNR